MNVVDALPDNLKKKGRPKGSGKLTMAKYADAKPLAMLPKTENQRVKELKELLRYFAQRYFRITQFRHLQFWIVRKMKIY